MTYKINHIFDELRNWIRQATSLQWCEIDCQELGWLQECAWLQPVGPSSQRGCNTEEFDEAVSSIQTYQKILEWVSRILIDCHFGIPSRIDGNWPFSGDLDFSCIRQVVVLKLLHWLYSRHLAIHDRHIHFVSISLLTNLTSSVSSTQINSDCRGTSKPGARLMVWLNMVQDYSAKLSLRSFSVMATNAAKTDTTVSFGFRD